MSPALYISIFLSFTAAGIFVIIYYFGKLLDYIIKSAGNRGLKIGPWKTHLGVGRPNLNKIEKSAIARIGLGANDSEETIYWNAFSDSNGDDLSSNNNYKILINSPPDVDFENYGFWSITVYGENKLFVENDIVRNKIKRLSEKINSNYS